MAFTLILWALAKREYKVSPVHQLVLVAKIVNRVSVCNVFERKKNQFPGGAKENDEIDSWQQVFAACNNVRVFALFLYM